LYTDLSLPGWDKDDDEEEEEEPEDYARDMGSLSDLAS